MTSRREPAKGYAAELAYAYSLADIADGISTRIFGRPHEVHLKADRTPVTEADTAIEAALRERLSRDFPEDAVLGEEEGAGGPVAARRTWVIDPIDGTKNFNRGVQIWGTLIALLEDGHPVLGVASAPALGERYGAMRGGGAAFNGKAIRVSEVASFGEATLCSTGVYTFFGTPWEGAYATLAREAQRTRGFGDFWAHMLVARGSVDVMVEPKLRIWDWAALQVIVEEAGGRMTQIDGSPLSDRGSVLSTNGALHDEMVASLGDRGRNVVDRRSTDRGGST